MSRTTLPVFPAQQPITLAPAAIPLHYVHPGLSFSQVLSILRAYRKQSMLIALAIVALTCLLVKVMPKSYAATATLMVDYKVTNYLGGDQLPDLMMSSYMSTQVELIQSPEILNPMISRLKLAEQPNYIVGYKGDGSTLNDWVLRRVSKQLKVEQGHSGSTLIYVTYSGRSPDEAAQVANAIADIYSDQQYQRLIGPSSDQAKRYSEQLAELKNKVNGAQDRLTEFRRANNLVTSDPHIDVDVETLSALEQRLLEAQNAARAADVRAATDQSVSGQVLASSLVQALKTQLATQEAKLAEARATLGVRHPQVLELESQIQATRRSLGTELQVYTRNASNERDAADQVVRQLQKQIDEQRHRILGVRQLQDEAAKYSLELDSAQAAYKRALDSYDQIMVASNGHYTNVRLISRAVPPLTPNKPDPLSLVLLGAVVAILAGVAAPLIYEMLDRRVRCSDDLERDHGVPVLVDFQTRPTPRALT
jgi:uncharacterized protein involved in exopolysaccharide biosynthesis